LPTYLATHLFTVAGAIVFDYVQRLLINALFYGKFTSNECRSISLPENGEKACQYGTGWLKDYALNNDNMHEHDLFIYLYQNLKTALILSSVSNVLTILLAYKYLISIVNDNNNNNKSSLQYLLPILHNRATSSFGIMQTSHALLL